jgi:hypothetical protein
MKLDLTITAPGMFSLKDLFELSLELDVEIITKITFAFHADIMWTPMSWPRHILNRHIEELVAYMQPLAGPKQWSVISTLESMRDSRQTHEEAFPETYKSAARNGMNWVKRLETIRKDKTTMATIYSADPELLAWWTSL